MSILARLGSSHKRFGELRAFTNSVVDIAISAGFDIGTVDEIGRKCRAYRVVPGMSDLPLEPMSPARVHPAEQKRVSCPGGSRHGATMADMAIVVSLVLGKLGCRISVLDMTGGANA